MTSVNDTVANFNTCQRLVKEAVGSGCKVVFFPECFAFIGAKPGEAQAMAEPLDGPVMGKYKELARDHSCWLSLGGFQESCAGESRIYNTHVVIDDTGVIQSTYRKIHLYDVPMVGLVESKQALAGDLGLVTCDSPAGVLGLAICYDMRFPEMHQQLTFQHGAQVNGGRHVPQPMYMIRACVGGISGSRHRLFTASMASLTFRSTHAATGSHSLPQRAHAPAAADTCAQVLLFPSAFAMKTGEAHWETLLRARAIECQTYVVASAQVRPAPDEPERAPSPHSFGPACRPACTMRMATGGARGATLLLSIHGGRWLHQWGRRSPASPSSRSTWIWSTLRAPTCPCTITGGAAAHR